MTFTLAFTLAWYLGALAVLWYVSVQYCEGATLLRTIPPGLIAILMLVTASGVYYEYTDAPSFRITYFFWAALILWVAITSLRNRRKSRHQ